MCQEKAGTEEKTESPESRGTGSRACPAERQTTSYPVDRAVHLADGRPAGGFRSVWRGPWQVSVLRPVGLSPISCRESSEVRQARRTIEHHINAHSGLKDPQCVGCRDGVIVVRVAAAIVTAARSDRRLQCDQGIDGAESSVLVGISAGKGTREAFGTGARRAVACSVSSTRVVVVAGPGLQFAAR